MGILEDAAAAYAEREAAKHEAERLTQLQLKRARKARIGQAKQEIQKWARRLGFKTALSYLSFDERSYSEKGYTVFTVLGRFSVDGIEFDYFSGPEVRLVGGRPKNIENLADLGEELAYRKSHSGQ